MLCCRVLRTLETNIVLRRGHMKCPQRVLSGRACTREDITATKLRLSSSPFFDAFPAATVDEAADRAFGDYDENGDSLPCPQLGGYVKVSSP